MTSKTSHFPIAITVICLAGPSLLAAFYYAFLAHPVYQTDIRFLPQPAISAAEAAPLLEAYLYSPELIATKEAELGLREHFAEARKDPFRRLPEDSSDDQLIAYFQERVTLHKSPEAPLLTLTVQAYTPDFAQLLANSLYQSIALKWGEIHASSAETEGSLLSISGAHRPDLRISPRPFRGIVTVFLLSGLLYGIGRLFWATVRDHTV